MLLAATALGGEPGWLVLETEDHRIVYPAEAREWTEAMAARLPAIRRAVEETIGHSMDARTDVLVRDPYRTANGAAYPFGRRPKMELWASTPGALEELGYYDSWGDVLLVHEDAHLVHLTRQPRNLTGRLVYELFGLGPVLRKGTPWLSEGYATLIEGRITGSGRPRGAYRATVLRRLAQRGELPTYEGMSGRWRYVVGSAFLEWLEAREPDGLPDLWARMSARRRRSLDEAFRGVYGAGVQALYNRFTVELTLDAARADGADWRRPHRWAELGGPSTGFDLSEDQERLAVTVQRQDGTTTLVVVEVAEDEEAIEKRLERAERLIENDPEDVVARDPDLPPHDVVRSYTSRSRPAARPRWVSDNHVLFDAPVLDGRGDIHRDLFRLEVSTGSVSRVTRWADVRAVYPIDARWAWAVRSRFGQTGLVKVNLATGEVHEQTPMRADVVVDQPIVGSDGRVVYLENAGNGFRPVILDEDGGREEVALPEGASAVSVVWRGDELLASLAMDGRFDIWRVLPGPPVRLTDTGGALQAAPSEQGLFHLELEPHHHVLHLTPEPVVRAESGRAPDLAGPADVQKTVFEEQPVEGRRMGIGPLHARILGSGMVSAGGSTVELGFRIGDIAGRNELLALGLVGDASGHTGGGLRWTNRTRRVQPSLRAWALQRDVMNPYTFGGSAELEIATRSSGKYGALVLGGWAESTDAEADGAGWADARFSLVGSRNRATGLWGAARGVVGPAFWRTRLDGGLWIGRRWRLDLDARFVQSDVPVGLGGAGNSILPEARLGESLRTGWGEFGVAGQRLWGWSAAYGPRGLQVAGERIWVDGAPHSFAGLRLQSREGEQALLGIPAMTVEMGVGCRVEQGGPPGDGACFRKEDVRAWTRVLWRP